MTRRLSCPLAAALVLVALAAPAAADDVIYRGTDAWKTVASTYTHFIEEPIPAGFFCPGSPAFTGKVEMRGVPIATEPAGALAGKDTLVGRLDDAVFDAEGVARTRIALIALNLESIEPVDTGCGLYDMRVVLDEEQPTTEMTIVREAVGGGSFEAPLAINALVRFTPVEGGERLELRRSIELGPGSKSVWLQIERPDEARVVRIDSDGDGVPDLTLAERTNFRAGVAPAALEHETSPALCEDVSCHCAEFSRDPWEPNWYCTYLHCTEVWIPCNRYPIPKHRGPTTDTPQPAPDTGTS